MAVATKKQKIIAPARGEKIVNEGMPTLRLMQFFEQLSNDVNTAAGSVEVYDIVSNFGWVAKFSRQITEITNSVTTLQAEVATLQAQTTDLEIQVLMGTTAIGI